MCCNGLLLTLADPAVGTGLRRVLAGRPGVTPGAQHDRWLAVATETAGPRHSEALHDWLRGLPGVSHVDVVHVAFDPPSPHPET